MNLFTRGAAVAAVSLALASPTALAGKANDTLVWATDREAVIVDPYYSNVRELVVIGHHVWDTLLDRDLETGEYVPLLATSHRWVDDTTLEFGLRDDVLFHDGTPFNAHSVVHTVNHVVQEDSGVLTRQNVVWMKSAERVDDHTVHIHLVDPFPAALAYIAGAVFIMQDGHYDAAETLADGQRDYGSLKPNGTGPYRVTESIPGERIVMKRNDAYFEGGPKGQAAIENLVFRTITDKNTQLAELLTGGVQWLWDVPKDQAERLDPMPQVQVTNAKTFRISYLQFDVHGKSGSDVFTNPLVRQAVAHAVNREAITRNLVGPASEVIHAACYPAQFGCTDDVPKWEYDPELAKKKLAEAGYPNGFEVDFYGYRERHFSEAVIGDLANVGIRTNLRWMQYRALRDLVWEGKTPINQMAWGSNSIPDASASTSHFFTGGRDDLAQDPDVIAWLKEADVTLDSERREKLYQKALARISEEVYWLPMFTYAKYYAYSSDLDFTPTDDEIPRFYLARWK